ncbi:MAG: beta-mannosidase [Bacteroidales bacterium]|nr:beta-mannosidase [Bacteroidales bacterium]
MQSKLLILMLGAALLTGCTGTQLPGKDEKDYGEGTKNELTLADPQATPETKALYSNLWVIKDKGFMFGHHDDLWCGRYWIGHNPKDEDDVVSSDTRSVCGDYPAVQGVDFAALIDDRYASDPTENSRKLNSVKQAYDMGMVNIVCLHLDNPLTFNTLGSDHYKKGGAWDNTSNQVVKQILTNGSEVQTTYKLWMDRLADIIKNLKGSDDKTIPIILRPYHEHNHDWSWWGAKCTTEQEYVELWRWTVKYLRDTKGVHNVIYAISPQIDNQGTESAYLTSWPGDDYVDFLGMDCYQGINNLVFTNNLKTLARISQAKGKPCGVTETGVQGFTKKDYWTQNIHAPMTGRKVSLLATWRNKYVGIDENDDHYFSVYPGHPSEADFVKMYNADNTFFCHDLPDMYTMAEGITVK